MCLDAKISSWQKLYFYFLYSLLEIFQKLSCCFCSDSFPRKTTTTTHPAPQWKRMLKNILIYKFFPFSALWKVTQKQSIYDLYAFCSMPKAVPGPSRQTGQPRGHDRSSGGAARSTTKAVRTQDRRDWSGEAAEPVRCPHARTAKEQPQQKACYQDKQCVQSETIVQPFWAFFAEWSCDR